MADFEYFETDAAKIYTSIIGKLMDYCDEALYPGDERRIFGEGLVQVFTALFPMFNDRAKQRVLRYARGEVLDEIGENLRVTRLAPSPASATFVFVVSAVQSQNIIIPVGTRITTDGSVYFSTTEAAILYAGSSYVNVPAECTEGGSVHNGYAPKTIATLVDLIPYIEKAYNFETTAGGDDGEPYTEAGDERYRERIRLAPASLSPGTESGYIYYAKSADPDISDVCIVCPAEEPNTVNIYVLMAGGESPDDDTLQKVLDTIETSNVRIMTDHVQTFAPEVLEYTIEAEYYCEPENEADVVAAIEGEGGVIDQYIAWQSETMGKMLLPDKLRNMMYNAGATMVNMNYPRRVTLGKTQVARLSGDPVITHEAVALE